MSDASVTKLNQKIVVNKLKRSKNESTADTLLRMMEDDPNDEFCAYFGNYSVAEQTVWMRKCRSKKRCKKRKAVVSKKTTIKSTSKEQLNIKHTV